MRCHLGLVKLLDFAKEIGILDRVSDDGRYWETRSVDVLLQNLRKSDSLVAAVAGGFRDARGDSAGMLVAPTADAPDFEQLEAEGVAQLDGGEFPKPIGEMMKLRVRSLIAEPAAPLIASPQSTLTLGAVPTGSDYGTQPKTILRFGGPSPSARFSISIVMNCRSKRTLPARESSWPWAPSLPSSATSKRARSRFSACLEWSGLGTTGRRADSRDGLVRRARESALKRMNTENANAVRHVDPIIEWPSASTPPLRETIAEMQNN